MKKTRVLLIFVCLLATANVALADSFGTGANQFTIDFVTISGSTNSTSGYGIVNNAYRMGMYEITNNQWTKFKATYGPVAGTPTTAYDSAPTWTGTNVPTNNVSWYEAAQFVNFLNTSKGYQAAYKFTGTQGTSSYAMGVWQAGDTGYNASNPFRNSNAFYFLPTENEWVKAAYWNGTALQTYATIGNIVPVAGVDTNYNLRPGNQPWNVGSGSQELNGTYDMMGNVTEWMESPRYNNDYLPSSDRGIRGGAYNYVVSTLTSSPQTYYSTTPPYIENMVVGFRVAAIPEPVTLLLLGLGGLMLRRKK